MRDRLRLHAAHDPPHLDRGRGPQGGGAGDVRDAAHPPHPHHPFFHERRVHGVRRHDDGVSVRQRRNKEGREHGAGLRGVQRDAAVHDDVHSVRHALGLAIHRRRRADDHRRVHRFVLLAEGRHAAIADQDRDQAHVAIPRRVDRARLVHRRGGSIRAPHPGIHQPKDEERAGGERGAQILHVLRSILHVVPRARLEVHQPERVHPRRGQGVLVLLLRHLRGQAAHLERHARRHGERHRRLSHRAREARRRRHVHVHRVLVPGPGPVHGPDVGLVHLVAGAAAHLHRVDRLLPRGHFPRTVRDGHRYHLAVVLRRLRDGQRAQLRAATSDVRAREVASREEGEEGEARVRRRRRLIEGSNLYSMLEGSANYLVQSTFVRSR
mmetsp:Transcript_15036/g.54217  ORF Transcript_15036/g.54217 Transcript_15036/m.54217 type:complete len:381 (-) Transcript_15036:26-1168(-)